MVATLLNLMDGISRVDVLLVIAATNRPDSIKAALRRPGRLDWDIEIGVPSPVQRLDICILLALTQNTLSDWQIQYLAMATHGHFDIIVEESGCSRNSGDNSSEILPSSHVSGTVSKTEDNFQNGVNSSSEGMFTLEEECTLKVILEVPKVNWEDVGGQREVKTQLMEAVEWPQKHQEAFKRIGTRPPTGILLFGPPGCSKPSWHVQ
ncbi:hypothetical protein Dsin_032987 [Dipteronia sinensis]|uniref:ATPase AAA-type core domain-containing protein n=1 Tax=Dipteronia sinensis TaxID=43782 RepID=A0AAD9Z5D7_9ROSI|nr:hypothetical protein Dsin_032987 [Dipteronia sinensis]